MPDVLHVLSRPDIPALFAEAITVMRVYRAVYGSGLAAIFPHFSRGHYQLAAGTGEDFADVARASLGPASCERVMTG